MSDLIRLQTPFEIPQSQPWDEDFAFFTDTANTVPRPIASANAEFRRLGKSASAPVAPIVLLSEDGELEIGDGVTVLRLTEDRLQDILAGEYELVHGLIFEDGGVLQVRAFSRVIP